MIGLPLSESTRAAALDGALSFSILLSNQRELTLNTAQSSVTGLLAAIQSAPAGYAQLLAAADNAVAAQNTAALRLSQPPWADAPAVTRDTIATTLAQTLAALIANARPQVTSANGQATAAKNAAANPSPEYTIASDLESAGNLLLTSLVQLESNNAAQSAQTLADARAQATSALQNAQTLLATLQAQNPPDAPRIAATQGVVAAALAMLAATDGANAAVSSVVAGAAGQTPTTFQLTTGTPPATYLTTWGDSGVISLTDATGQGVVIAPDGKVDTIPPSGNGWQFQHDATFLLPDGTKISFTPGTPASVLATRGQQRIEITNLQPGQTPSATRFTAGGLAADAARNDGYIFVMGGDQRDWTLAGSPLGGGPGGREVVATTPQANELTVDVTNITLDASLLAQLQALGIDATTFDTNHDGRFSNRELQGLVGALDAAVGGAQTRFDSAIQNTATAAGSLLRLNQFIEKLLAESDRRQADREQGTAEERDQLLQIRRDLDEARSALRGPPGPGPAQSPQPGVLAAARLVLNQIEDFGGKDAAPVAAIIGEGTPSLSTDPLPTAIPSGPEVTKDPLAQALRRAGRILSGLGSGAPVRSRAEAPAQAPTPKLNPDTEISARPTPPPEPVPVSSLVANDKTTSSPTLGSPPTDLASVQNTLLPQTTAPDQARAALVSSSPQITPPDVTTSPQKAKPTTLPSDNGPVAVQSTLPGLESKAPAPLSLDALLPEVRTPPFAPLTPTSPTVSALSNEKADVPLTPPAPPTGLQPLAGTRFPATGPDTNVAPDPTFGAPDGFAQESRRRIDQHFAVHREQLGRAQQLQSTVRDVVARFVTLVSQDDELRQVFNAADLSDTQRDELKAKVVDLERGLGLSWGGDPIKTQQGEANLSARVLTSGMMI